MKIEAMEDFDKDVDVPWDELGEPTAMSIRRDRECVEGEEN